MSQALPNAEQLPAVSEAEMLPCIGPGPTRVLQAPRGATELGHAAA